MHHILQQHSTQQQQHFYYVNISSSLMRGPTLAVAY
jgi:hypothetical protein